MANNTGQKQKYPKAVVIQRFVCNFNYYALFNLAKPQNY